MSIAGQIQRVDQNALMIACLLKYSEAQSVPELG